MLNTKNNLATKEHDLLKIQSLFNAIASLPICVESDDQKSLVNTISGITISIQPKNIKFPFRLINGNYTWELSIRHIEKILKAWIILSKPYYVMEWHDEATNAPHNS